MRLSTRARGGAPSNGAEWLCLPLALLPRPAWLCAPRRVALRSRG